MAEPGATLEPGDDLTRMNHFTGNTPPGDGGRPAGGADDPLRGALTQIGALLTARAQKRFRDQRFGSAPWVARSVPNIAGILNDLEHGRTPPSRRWDDRPALQDTGRLKGSITWRIVSGNSVEIGSNLSYAAEAQEGTYKIIPITDTMKRGLRKLVAQGKDNAAGDLAFLANRATTTYNITTPERIFVGIDDDDEGDINRVIERWFGGQPYEVEIQ